MVNKQFAIFKDRLEWYVKSRVKPVEDDEGFFRERTTYCTLILLDKGLKYPKFEVRGVTFYNKKVVISAVNWTVMAGTCTIEIEEGTLHKWAILEDNPTLRTLYGV